jgi:hypothetical protein
LIAAGWKVLCHFSDRIQHSKLVQIVYPVILPLVS